MEQVLSIALCMSLCFFAWGFFYMGLHRNGIGYVRGYAITTVYFSAFAALVALLFRAPVVWAFENISIPPLVLVAVFMVAQFALYVWLAKHLQHQSRYLAAHPDRYYLQIDWRRLISKSADIFAQQMFIIVLVVLLRDVGLSLWQVMAWFFVLFSLLHVPLVVSEWGKWPSWVFSGAVALFSVIFPPLILLVQYGFVYTFMLHWLFYTLMLGIFWLRYEQKAVS